MGPFGGADLDPTSFLATTEHRYNEAFRRTSHQAQAKEEHREGSPESQKRKSGVYNMISGEEVKEESAKKKSSTEKQVSLFLLDPIY
jgi:hypothetical protein